MTNERISIQRLFSDNLLFFALLFVFFLVAGSVVSQIDKGDVILWFNERHTELSDIFFKYFTKIGEEVTYIAIILTALAFRRFRLAAGVALVGIIVTIVSSVSKGYFDHPRPSLFFQREGIFESLQLVEGVVLHNAHTSFPSGHTMSGFALFTFLALATRNKSWAGIVFAMTAILVGLSRIYLVQHFLQDVLLGGIMGAIIGFFLFWSVNNFKKNQKKD